MKRVARWVTTCAMLLSPLIIGASGSGSTSAAGARLEVAEAVPAVLLKPAVRSTRATTVAPRVPVRPASGGSSADFAESFDGNSGEDRFRTGVFYRERDAPGFNNPNGVSTTRWNGDHDMACGGADTSRTLAARDASGAFDDDALTYTCRDHLMTSMGHTSGYSVIWFAPDQVFSSVSRVCWEVNVTGTELMGDRQWWEVAVIPAGASEVSAISWLAGTANVPNYGEIGATVLGFGPDNPPVPKLSVGNSDPQYAFARRGSASQNVKTRVPHCLTDNGNNTITFDYGGVADTPVQQWTFTGSFPEGPLEVVFKDHNYTPDKGCEHLGGKCANYTWHWDNIVVES